MAYKEPKDPLTGKGRRHTASANAAILSEKNVIIQKETIKFKAMLYPLIPGNFISWEIRPSQNLRANEEFPGKAGKIITVPKNYEILDIEPNLAKIGVTITQRNPLAMPVINNVEKLRETFFEFEKVDRKTFRVLDVSTDDSLTRWKKLLPPKSIYQNI